MAVDGRGALVGPGSGQRWEATVGEPFRSGGGQVFGEAAALYDRFRPSYPRQLVEAVVADAGAHPVLEIGAGTGKATKALLALGMRVHALEPDPRMAALLDLNCRPHGGVEVITATLETADLPPDTYEVAVAAQSWHWLDPAVAYDRAADALRPDGRLALLWHTPLPRQGLFGAALDQLYARMVPDLTRPLPGTQGGAGFDPAVVGPSATTRFDDWTRLEHRWQRELDAAGLVGWLCSTSRHRRLPLDTRTDLMAAVTALVEELGGVVTVDMSTVAHLARRLS